MNRILATFSALDAHITHSTRAQVQWTSCQFDDSGRFLLLVIQPPGADINRAEPHDRLIEDLCSESCLFFQVNSQFLLLFLNSSSTAIPNPDQTQISRKQNLSNSAVISKKHQQKCLRTEKERASATSLSAVCLPHVLFTEETKANRINRPRVSHLGDHWRHPRSQHD